VIIRDVCKRYTFKLQIKRTASEGCERRIKMIRQAIVNGCPLRMLLRHQKVVLDPESVT
jgi:hypothetical protein